MIESGLQEKIDSLFETFNQPGSPGCALGVMRDGELIYKQGYGLANLEHNVAITPSTTFYIASMAKQFTGMAAAMLAARGLLDLDADIRTYLPYVPDFGHTITSKHLLYHTSGLRSDIFLLILSGWRIEDVITQNDIVEFVKGQKELDFAPGEEFSYCGTGYILLAEIVAAVSEQPFPEFCSENIFRPLGMANTRFEADPIALVPGRANAYFEDSKGEFKNAVLTISILGGTGMYTTIEDLALWDKNFATGQVGGTAALEMMQTAGVRNSGESVSYAFGLVVDEHRGQRVISHAGDSAGIHCYMMRFPDAQLSVAVLGNSGTVRASALAPKVADIMLGIDPEDDNVGQAGAPNVMALEVEAIAARAGRYYDANSGGFVDLAFDEGVLSVYGYELLATSENEYFLKQHPEISIVFEGDGSNEVTATVDFGNGLTSYKRVESVEPTSDELAAYAGVYHSRELDVVWRIEMRNGQLTVDRKRQGRSGLVSICQDVFADPWAGEIMHGNAQWVIAFDRDHDNITGLRVTAAMARGRNLRFDRVKGLSAQ